MKLISPAEVLNAVSKHMEEISNIKNQRSKLHIKT